MSKVEFISYTGGGYSYCMGELTVKINNEEVNLGKCLCSGGYIDENWEAQQGPWEILDLPKKYEKYRNKIKKVVNENIPWGCCGGCI